MSGPKMLKFQVDFFGKTYKSYHIFTGCQIKKCPINNLSEIIYIEH